MTDEISKPVYVIDTCSLTELKNKYPQKAFPSVWDLVEALAGEGRLISVEEVAVEIDAVADEVTEWAKAHESIFVELDEKLQLATRVVLAKFPNLIDVKKRKSSADPFVIALALLREATVVTQEKPSGGPGKVKIPDVCQRLGIPCIPLLTMLLNEGLGS
ncbi:DUF4411 family protein [Gemmatimonas sp. UBA7669]|uniref:DUF4411 family protein n=1 Tax=Gemmatimonas sp. UBA7669 TaxID=1946568 RepID=UPI0025B917EC|nr:DUF4411 family protein [Gemmatimonas sp. UBA7669]